MSTSPVGHLGLPAGAGPLTILRASLSGGLLRIGPAWAVLAGALSSRTPLDNGAALLRLAGAMVLADVGWGIVWRLTAADSAEEAQGDAGFASFAPYAQPGALLARIRTRLQHMAAIHGASAASSWHELLVGLALIVVLGLLLGLPAFLLSCAAILVVFWSWSIAQRGFRPALCHSLVGTALPWMLGVTLAGVNITAEDSVAWFAPGVLMVAFATLQWRVHRAYLGLGTRGIWLGQAAVLAALIWLRQPVAAAVAACLLAPPYWWLARVGPAVQDVSLFLARSAPWWWATMILAAIAARIRLA
ncbi:MAG: hypothetical protein FJ011_02130 [Chloroflexi bacterium]|nr:hypothetical protein [Chloroflexota bacterium]